MILTAKNGIKLKMTAAVPRMYRNKFGSDIILGMDEMYERLREKQGTFTEKEIEMLENLTYICSKHADPEQPEEIEIWMAQYDVNAVYDTFPEIINLWNENLRQTSTAKKKTENQ